MIDADLFEAAMRGEPVQHCRDRLEAARLNRLARNRSAAQARRQRAAA